MNWKQLQYGLSASLTFRIDLNALKIFLVKNRFEFELYSKKCQITAVLQLLAAKKDTRPLEVLKHNY